MKKIILLLVITFLIGVASQSYGQYILRPPTSRFSRPSQKGNILYVANSIINTGALAQTTENPPAGTGKNNAFLANYIDIDGDATTFSSSSADLTLASCTQVLFAGLYWGAGRGGIGGVPPANSTNDTAWITAAANTIKFKLPVGGYTNITASQVDKFNQVRVRVGLPAANISHSGYMCFADVTSMVTGLANPNGTYTLANMVGPVAVGKNGGYGGWTMVIVYADPTLQVRNLTVFDGCVVVSPGATVDVLVSGFITPLVGPVSCELGAVVIDGDRQDGIDAYLFRQQGAVPFVDLTPTTPAPGNATSRLDDMWNSTISYKGVVVPTRNPAFVNTYGYDADIFELPNPGNANFGNNRTSATVRFTTTAETYSLQVLTTSISNFNPTFSFAKTSTDLSGGALTPGDSLRYRMDYANLGNDASTNSRIIDNIPTGTSYKPGSIRINGVLQTDAVDGDQANYDFANNRIIFNLGTGATGLLGGEIPPSPAAGSNGNVTFDVYMPSSCAVISCSGTMRNRARMLYNGKISLSALEDSSGVLVAGCLNPQDKIDIVTGSCSAMGDTILTNTCPALTVSLPVARYAGYTFHSGIPFTAFNRYNGATPVTFTRVMYAYYDAPGACIDDTARIAIFITGCPDIDDDDDGLPDYLESTDPVAIADQDTDGRPNWADNSPGAPILWVDNNIDNINDWYDPGADADNDGILNFYDVNYFSYVDTNGDGVNDRLDKDLDGIPNYLDLDSDNDGIPDTVESFGVDTNGDGRIDNYADVDADGLSDNVDSVTSGGQFLRLSGLGLGAIDTDVDLIPNYLDLDSDNDGIPDVVEASGPDVNNNGIIDGFIDGNANGLHDSYILGSALLLTGADVGPVDGRADDYPNKNKDRDFRPNAYDMDADGDGIADVIEAGLPDANFNGIVDGVLGTNGWSTTVSGMPALNLRYTDADIYPDYLDIDSDEDGIPDNIEGMSTLGYFLPTLVDADGDGLMNPYDNAPGAFGGSGIFVYDHDGDGTPDYRDLDTDGDSQPDIIEGNDFNLNGIADDNVTLTFIDTDGDGLDNRFDSLTSVTNIKGTSYRMGTGGTFTGDAAPGSRTTVQRRFVFQTDRDWRYVGVVLPVQFLSFTGLQQNNTVILSWTIITDKEVDHFEIERSSDNNTFIKTGIVTQPVLLQVQQSFEASDNISTVSGDIIYYRLKVVGKGGEIKYSNILVMRKTNSRSVVTVMPNPANNYVFINFVVEKEGTVTIRLINNIGKIVRVQEQKFTRGSKSIKLDDLSRYSAGVYNIQVLVNDEIINKKLIITK